MMINTFIKSALLTLPLITACGSDHSGGVSSEKPDEPSQPAPEEPRKSSAELTYTRLGDMILTYSFTRGILSYEDYNDLLGRRMALIIKGKLRLYVSYDELGDHDLFWVDDAIQDGGWLEKFDESKVAEEIRQIAYANRLIDRSDLELSRRERMVPTFRDGIREDYHESDLLRHWMIDSTAAFEGGIMRRRSDEELRAYEEKPADKQLAITQLGNRILTYSLSHFILNYEDYKDLTGRRMALIIKGKLRFYVSYDELAEHGISSVEDAIQDGGWLEKFDEAKVAEEIRQIAYVNRLIDRSELDLSRSKRMVPTFWDGIREDYHESDLLRHWMIDSTAAFEGGIMQRRSDEELRAYEEKPADKQQAITQLGNMILTYSLKHFILTRDDYKDLTGRRMALIIKGKLLLYVSYEELADYGISSVEDAIQDGGWIEKFDYAKVAEEIRQIAYANQLIDRSDLELSRRERTVPTFRDYIRVDIHENYLLQNRIFDTRAAFEGGLMPKRSDEELQAYKETVDNQ